MKRRVKKDVRILIIIIVTISVFMGSVYFLTQGRMDDTVKVEPAAYQDLLAKCERALKDPTYPTYLNEEEKLNADDIYYWIRRCIGRYPVYYCIDDLDGDGREELILGAVEIDTPIELFGKIYDEVCHPFAVYTYEGEEAKLNILDGENVIRFYEGGIVEYIYGRRSRHFLYYLAGNMFQPLGIIVEEQSQDEEPRYYRGIDGEDGRTTEYIDITEEEFHTIRNRYATTVERLDWKPLEGFWEPEGRKQISLKGDGQG